MDELNRNLANGLLGLDQAEQAMSGNLTGAYRDMAAREAVQQRYDDQSWQPACRRLRDRQPQEPSQRLSGPLVPLPTVTVALVLVLALVVAVAAAWL